MDGYLVLAWCVPFCTMRHLVGGNVAISMWMWMWWASELARNSWSCRCGRYRCEGGVDMRQPGLSVDESWAEMNEWTWCRNFCVCLLVLISCFHTCKGLRFVIRILLPPYLIPLRQKEGIQIFLVSLLPPCCANVLPSGYCTRYGTRIPEDVHTPGICTPLFPT